MDVKTLEIRDRGTFIPALAVRLDPRNERDIYLLARAGFGLVPEYQARYVLLTQLEQPETQYDPHSWGVSRTMREAHIALEIDWDRWHDGAVLDVEYVLGETIAPKQSEAALDAPEPVRVCPMCEGKKVTGRFQPSPNEQDAVKLLGITIPVIDMVDRPCGMCGGKGVLPTSHPQFAAGDGD